MQIQPLNACLDRTDHRMRGPGHALAVTIVDSQAPVSLVELAPGPALVRPATLQTPGWSYVCAARVDSGRRAPTDCGARQREVLGDDVARRPRRTGVTYESSEARNATRLRSSMAAAVSLRWRKPRHGRFDEMSRLPNWYQVRGFPRKPRHYEVVVVTASVGCADRDLIAGFVRAHAVPSFSRASIGGAIVSLTVKTIDVTEEESTRKTTCRL